jgi:hypothetical protein
MTGSEMKGSEIKGRERKGREMKGRERKGSETKGSEGRTLRRRWFSSNEKRRASSPSWNSITKVSFPILRNTGRKEGI